MTVGIAAAAEALADMLLAPATPDELSARVAALAPALDISTVAALKVRVDATKLRNAGRALEIAAVAEAVAARIGAPAAEGLALWARGNALYHLSRYGEALASYRRAEQFYNGPEHALDAARLQINQVAVLQDLGAFAEALATAEAARAACGRIGEPARRFLALLEMNSGAAFQQLARPAEALAAYERGRAVFVALGDQVETARIDMNRANVLQEMGRFATAEGLYRSARDALAAAGADQEVARAEHNVGKLAYRRGRYQEALAHLEAARVGYAAIPNPLEVAKADLYRALVYRDLGMHEEALPLAAAAGRAFARARTSWELAIALSVEGVGHARLGTPEAAAPLLERARRLLRRQGAVERLPPLDAERAALALAAGRPAQARRLAARLVREVSPTDWPGLAARARLTLSAAYLAEGRVQPAARLAHEARDLAARYALPELAAAHYAVAQSCEAVGDDKAAWTSLRAAVVAAEELRARLPLDDLRLAFLDSHQPIYRAVVRHALLAHGPALALAAVELALSAPLPRTVLPPGDPAVREELRARREEWAYLQSAIDEPRAGHGPPVAALDQRRRELEAVIADLSRRLAIQAAHADQARMEPGQALTDAATDAQLRSLQARLAPDQALLAYAPAGDALFALLVTRGAICCRRLPGSVAQLERLLRSWRFSVEHALATAADLGALPSADAHLRRLYANLLASLEPELAAVRRLVVAVPPEWHDLPFAAALGPNGHLIASHSLSFVAAPGAAGRAVAAPSDGPALVVGCSDGGRLPEAPREAATVAGALRPLRPVRLLVEREASRAAVLAALPECAIVHLAAHAAHRPDNPLFSWARLADGHLAVADLGELSLRQRPLVVLSACETGRGQARGGGLLGMARGFMLAGASGLVASLWKIADGSTARLMADFYSAPGLAGDPAAALAAAQRQALACGEHPFHWAAFVCVEG